MKLIVYFSASGVTREVANKIKEVADCDIFELKPLVEYTDEDLNWMNPKSRSSIEMKDLTSRVEYKDDLGDIDEYDHIYIGFPVWWYTCPHIVNTFLDKYKFDGKVVKVFFTSGSTKEKTVENSLKNIYPFIKNYKRFNKNVSLEEINNWLMEE